RVAADRTRPTTGNASATDAMGALAKGKGLETSADASAQRQAQEILWPWVATRPLRMLLVVMNTLAFQNHIHEWARDHRLHHKYTDTDADPHNSTRGFFFSHVGWLLVRKHPHAEERAKLVDMSDIEQDEVVMFQKKYYRVLMPLICFIIPTIIPVYVWNETWENAWFVAMVLRYTLSLNGILLVNSAAHMWGNKPYDKSIKPAENPAVSFLATGEGWHNYHHTFPWDYKPAELGNYRANFATAFIDFFALIGWAYDLKTVPASSIQNRMARSGDGSHEMWGRGEQG
ncbi:Acyl-CoA Delta(11) desaturase, partial [Gryllus bimaculatus]